MIFFLNTFSYLGVSRCHCHQFLPSFRKEGFRAGNLLAPDPSLLSSVKTGMILASSTEEQRLLAVPVTRVKYRCAHSSSMEYRGAPSRCILATNVGAHRLAFFQ